MIRNLKALLNSRAFKIRPFFTLINCINLFFIILFNKSTKFEIKLNKKKIFFFFKSLRLNKFGGRGLFVFRKNIEPFKDYNSIILYNSKINKLKNIKIINKVLSNNIASYKLDYSRGNTSASIVRSFQKKKLYKVNSITINKIFIQYNLKKIDFIKLDIEGAEFKALKGAVKVLKKFKPKIVVECGSSLEFKRNLNFLKKFDYNAYIFNENLEYLEEVKKFSRIYANLFYFTIEHINFFKKRGLKLKDKTSL